MAMICLRCGAEFEGQRALCNNCFAAKQAEPSPEEVMFPKKEPIRLRAMFKDTRVFIFCVVVSLLLLFLLYAQLTGDLLGSKLPAVFMPSSGAVQAYNPCEGKNLCLVVFVSSADSASALRVRDVATALDYNSHVGLQVVVGMDRPEIMVQSANMIGNNISLDNVGEFAHKASPGVPPFWWLLNTQREILVSFSGVPPMAETPQAALQKFASEKFGRYAGSFK